MCVLLDNVWNHEVTTLSWGENQPLLLIKIKRDNALGGNVSIPSSAVDDAVDWLAPPGGRQEGRPSRCAVLDTFLGPLCCNCSRPHCPFPGAKSRTQVITVQLCSCFL